MKIPAADEFYITQKEGDAINLVCHPRSPADSREASERQSYLEGMLIDFHTIPGFVSFLATSGDSENGCAITIATQSFCTAFKISAVKKKAEVLTQ